MYQGGFPISFDKLIISCSKSVSSTHSVDQMKKQHKFDVLLESLGFTTHSLMVFPFAKFLTDNLKPYGLVDPVNVLENVLIDILKNVPAVPFSFTTNALPHF